MILHMVTQYSRKPNVVIENDDNSNKDAEVESKDEESQGAIVKWVHTGGRNRCRVVIRGVSKLYLISARVKSCE